MNIDSLVCIKLVFNKCPPSMLVTASAARDCSKHSQCRFLYPHRHGHRSAHFVDDKTEAQ